MGWYADYKARGESRRKKRDCIHEWNDAGKVGFDGTRALYCPICDKSIQASETNAKVLLNEVMIRKLHDGSRKEHPCRIVIGGKNAPTCTYPIGWRHEDEKELLELYSREQLRHSTYTRMLMLERRRAAATGLPTNREGSRARVEFMEREARECKADPLQAALARNKQSQDDLSAAVQRLSDAVDRRLAKEEAIRELRRRLDKIDGNVR